LLLREDFFTKKQLMLLACDFAEQVLHIYEEKYPDDDRPRKAIETARLYAYGKATLDELKAVAWDAAWDAWDARDAWDAWAAARAAEAVAWVAEAAARAAERDAMATWEAAWAAEGKWQVKRVMEELDRRE